MKVAELMMGHAPPLDLLVDLYWEVMVFFFLSKRRALLNVPCQGDYIIKMVVL